MFSKIMLAAAIVAAGGSAAAAAVVQYNAGAGTLPTAQGWSFLGDSTAGTAVSGGVLSYGPTTTSGTTYWGATPPLPTIDFSSTVWTLSADVQLTGTTFGNVSGFRRGGFVLYLSDNAGRWIIADIGDSSAGLRNDNNGTDDPSVPVALSNGFHRVTLEAGPGGGRLLVDNVPLSTLAFGSGSAPNLAQWGEQSILASSVRTDIRFVELVPTPGSVAAFGLAGLAAGRRRRN